MLAKNEGRFLLNITLDKKQGWVKISWSRYNKNRKRCWVAISFNDNLE